MPASSAMDSAFVHASSTPTVSQRRIWTGQRLSPGAPLYNMAIAFTIEGTLDHGRLDAAFRSVVADSDALRSVFSEEHGEPAVRIVDSIDAGVDLIDFAAHEDSRRAADVWLADHTRRPFDLARQLFASALLRIDEDTHIWFLNQHHLICDAWSCRLIFTSVAQRYQAIGRNDPTPPQPLPRYRDFQAWERMRRSSESGRGAAVYWRDTVGAGQPELELYGRRTAATTTAASRISCDLGHDRSARLRTLAAEAPLRSISSDLSLLYLLSSMLFAYLYRVSGQQKHVVGTPAHNRSSPAFRQTPGLFVELFPLQATVPSEPTFRALSEAMIPAVNETLRHAEPGASSELPGNPYAIILNYITARFGNFCDLKTDCSWIHTGHNDPGHALRIQIHDFNGCGSLQLLFEFNEEVFPEHLRAPAVGHFLTVMDACLADPERSIDEISLLGPDEHRVLVERYNDTEASRPRNATVLDLFHEQVRRGPDRVAVADGMRELSYRRLDSMAQSVASHLQATGIDPASPVAVHMDRSAELLAVLLGIMKAGAPFLPIDSAFPPARVAAILEDSGATLVLTRRGLTTILPEGPTPVVCCEDLDLAGETAATGQVTDRVPDGTNVAYVIYTSGSTGQPKGVVIEHRSLLNYLLWARAAYMADGPHAMPLFSSIAADLTITSMLLPLVSGAAVVVYPERHDGVDLSILDVFKDDRVGIIKLTPSHLALLDGANAPTSNLQKLIVGGEDFKCGLARRVTGLFGGDISIYNEYGPTEATVGCMIHRFDPERERGGSVAIGAPIDNLRIYLLDRGLNPVPEGVAGDIYIAGAGLARGYLGRPDLTAERFVDDPFLPGERMYRSGDIGRWRIAGVMDYLGRGDQQVKVRGFRIECGEIEAALLAVPGISASFVQVIEHTPAASQDIVAHCRTCGLPSNVPRADLDEAGICAICRRFERQRDIAGNYFRSVDELRPIVAEAQRVSRGPHDCLMQYSGGKDSTFALYKLVEMGMHPLVFSFDNGFIPQSVTDNVENIVADLGLELVWGRTPAMNEIFVDSLRRFSNVCNGCQKAINTMSVSLAVERGIGHIFTGLSRGQSFETRVADLIGNDVVDAAEIDRAILEARKAYHLMDDAVSRNLDMSAFADESVFERVRFIDFYRYCDVSLAEILTFLNEKTPWRRPPDTGRSTNCLINEAGIYVHRRERGFHNYAPPYSWDVRLGHKERDSALAELDDDIDEHRVRRMLAQIGYDPDEKTDASVDRRLAAYYVGMEEFAPETLRSLLARTLPSYMIPAHFVRMDSFPLGASGKVDRAALPSPDGLQQSGTAAYAAPRNDAETLLAVIWADVLGVERVGINDNFFDLGGDSILNIQIVSQAVRAGLQITPALLFQNQTVAELAAASGSGPRRGDRTGRSAAIRFTPIQRWFFDLGLVQPAVWHMRVSLDISPDIAPSTVEESLQLLIENHGSLRLRFTRDGSGWHQSSVEHPSRCKLIRHRPGQLLPEAERQFVETAVFDALSDFELDSGCPLQALYFERGGGRRNLLEIAIHHLAVDGISWHILLGDLEFALDRGAAGQPVELPPETTSFQTWSEKLYDFANSAAAEQEIPFWRSSCTGTAFALPRDFAEPGNGTESSSTTVVVSLDAELTTRLARDVPASGYATVDELLLSAFVRSMHDWTGSSFIRLDKEGHGREEEVIEDTDLLRTTGWFTSIFPLNIIVPADADDTLLIQAIRQQVRAIPRRGFGYGPLRYLLDNGSGIPEFAPDGESELVFNYLGNIDLPAGSSGLLNLNGPLRIVRGPENHRCYLIEVNCFIFNRRLEMHWSFSTDRHLPETIDRVANRFLHHAARMIDVCLDATATPAITSPSREDIEKASVAPGDSEKVPYPLTPVQAGMLFHTLKEPGSGVYVEQFCSAIPGPLNIDLFQQAWEIIIRQHEVLRTSFTWDDLDQPQQHIQETAPASWHIEHLQDTSVEALDARRRDYLRRDRSRGFALDDSPLMRFALFVSSDKPSCFVWTFHHIICDGWSTSRIIQQVSEIYRDLLHERSVRDCSGRPFRDFVTWLLEQDRVAAERFWKRYLGNKSGPTPIPIQRADRNPAGWGRKELRLAEQVTADLESVARQKRVTLNTIVQGAWALLLHRYSGDKDIIFGTTVAGRPPSLEGADRMIGLFINTIPLRTTVEPDSPVSVWLATLMAEQTQARDYEFSSLVDIHGWSDFQPNVPLFESIVVFENYPSAHPADQHDSDPLFIDVEYLEQSNYPLSFIALPENRFRLILIYDTARFADIAISRLLHHLQAILEAFVDDPDRRIGSLSMLTSADSELLRRWRGGPAPDPPSVPVHALFEHQAAANGDREAIRCGAVQLSYAELNHRANRLAHHLRAIDGGTPGLHGIFIDRSVDMIIAMLAVLKAGAAYVPLDPAYPPGRISFMLDDARPRTVLTRKRLADSLPGTDAVVISIDDELCRPDTGGADNPEIPVAPESLAYVIYTSGSTGTPKGVLITHTNLSNATERRIRYYDSPPERFLLLSSISFDSSVAGIFGTLCRGGSLVIPGQERHREIDYLARLIKETGITDILAVPSLYQQLLEFHGDDLGSLKTVIVAGEPCPGSLAEGHRDRLPAARLYNEYGPTEATVWSTVFDCRDDHPATAVPIGRPIEGCEVFVLDDAARPVPPGVPGELYLGGPSVSPGYLNRPELTAARFVTHNPPGERGRRVYRTGDLVRFLEDGMLQFLGRSDEQIKLRGYRIELGEIEAALLGLDGVRQAVVAAQHAPGPDTRQTVAAPPTEPVSALVAYLVPHQGANLDHRAVRSSLAGILPDYMIPSDIVVLSSLPVTPSGKIDRGRLPGPEKERGTAEANGRLPESALEKEIAAIWREVLGRDRVTMADNFFELGGHSLTAVRIFAMIRKRLGLDLPLSTLFESPTLQELVEHLERLNHPEEDGTSRIEPGSPDDSGRRKWWVRSFRRTERNAWQVVVPIQRGGALPPLFLLHAIGGNILNYSAMIPYLDNEQPVYGLQAVGLDGITTPFQNLRDMMDHYVNEIQKIQPRGPYFFAGLSLGGVLALEIAQVLKQQGNQIPFVGLFDTLGPNAFTRRVPQVAGEADGARADKIIFDREALQTGKRPGHLPHPGLLSRVPFSWPNNRASSMLAHLVNLSASSILRILRVPRPPDLREWIMIYSTLKAINTYRPKPYEIRITLFRSSYSPVKDPYYGWGEVAQAGMDIIDVPAKHGNKFLESPELGLALNRCLRAHHDG